MATGEVIDFDVIYLFVMPFSFSVTLAFLRRKTRLYSYLTLTIFLLVEAVLFVYARDYSLNQQATWFRLGLILSLPLLIVFATSCLPLFERRPYLIVAIGPFIYWFGYIVGVNLWFAFGLPH